jgi:hypothetical protein
MQGHINFLGESDEREFLFGI